MEDARRKPDRGEEHPARRDLLGAVLTLLYMRGLDDSASLQTIPVTRTENVYFVVGLCELGVRVGSGGRDRPKSKVLVKNIMVKPLP